MKLSIHNNTFSFTSDNQSGWHNSGFRIETHEGHETAIFEEQHRRGNSLVIKAHYPKHKISETITFAQQDSKLIISRQLQSHRKTSLDISKVSMGHMPGGGYPKIAHTKNWELRMAHLDHLRLEKFPWCRPEYPYIKNLPQNSTRFGHQESQAAPYLAIMGYDYHDGLIEGQLEQRQCRITWDIAAAPNQQFSVYLMHWETISGQLHLRPNEQLDLEPVFLQHQQNVEPEKMHLNYIEQVCQRNTLQGNDNPLLEHAFYCSWNYGIMYDISESSLLKTARCIAERLPAIRYFLIDGGWIKDAGCPDTSIFYEDIEQTHLPERFPNGMKGVADKIRATGLKPAIWWTPSVSLSSKLAKEHPEWLAKHREGGPYRLGDVGYLDFSIPEVQTFLKSVFHTMFHTWGYEAMKMDFWSQSVESEDIRYQTGSGVQWRDWLLETIQDHLPKDGFLMTCVAVAMGNPFLGKFVQTYRAGIDVGNCNWKEHVMASIWLQPLLSTPGKSTSLINIDGIGFSQLMSPQENLHRLIYGFITMGSLEIDGRLETLDDAQIDTLQRLSAHMDRGHSVFCPDDEPYTGVPLPKVLYVPYPENSKTYQRGVRMHIALFNWSEEEQLASFMLKKIGLEPEVQTFRDVLNDDVVKSTEQAYLQTLAPHSARLLEVLR